MAIAWVLSHPEVTTALIGASEIDQLEQTCESTDNLKFSEDELRQIDEILAECQRRRVTKDAVWLPVYNFQNNLVFFRLLYSCAATKVSLRFDNRGHPGFSSMALLRSWRAWRARKKKNR